MRWGNEVWSGKPFAEVAKAHSQEPHAEDGGLHDWTTKGALRSTVLDEAVFAPSLPPGALSPILEDLDGFHIVRVIERQPVNRTPFADVQNDIKKRLHDGDKDRQRVAYINKLREQMPVMTIFDEDFIVRALPPENKPPQ